jgi:hypothetical protein
LPPSVFCGVAGLCEGSGGAIGQRVRWP